jgi:hypothetical protein
LETALPSRGNGLIDQCHRDATNTCWSQINP